MRRRRACARERPRRWTYLGRRREEDAAAAAADRGAEVDVLGVEEVPLVEQADGFGVGARDQQAGAADPVDERSRRVSRSTQRSTGGTRASYKRPTTFWRSSPSGEIIGPNEISGRPLAVDEPRPGDGGLRMRRQPRDQRVDRAARDDGVAVEEQKQLPLVARMPALLPAANPTLRLSSTSCTAGQRCADAAPRCRRSTRCRRR